MTDCEACGIEHASQWEADEMHAAMSRVRAQLRADLNLALNPVDLTPKKKAAPLPKLGDALNDRKPGCRGYGQEKEKSGR